MKLSKSFYFLIAIEVILLCFFLVFFFKLNTSKKFANKFFANYDTEEQYHIAIDNLMKPIKNEFEILRFNAVRNPADFKSYSIYLFVLPKDEKKDIIENIKEKINKQIMQQKKYGLVSFLMINEKTKDCLIRIVLNEKLERYSKIEERKIKEKRWNVQRL